MEIEKVFNIIKNLSSNGLGAPVLVIVMLAMVIVPLPPFGLDIFFTFNICLSLVVLLVTIYAMRPLDFAIFPTILLIATVLRLALNIASTRIVLLEGHTGTASAGSVIESFGSFVVGGNYAVGLVVFSILVIINFVVVTKGAGRVSEVSARFTLDAMPGKQMAIDADLNAGIISQEDAKTRREDISSEADFYGAMDGASKFVRGDAIAGILILLINILGGFAIGILQHNLSLSEAAHNYTLLTIGDGLVAQIPSLLLSTATAIVVTRVSSSQDMSEQLYSQVFSSPRVIYITATIIGTLGLIPGMPNIAFLTTSLILLSFGYTLSKKAMLLQNKEEAKIEEPAEVKSTELTWNDMKPVDIIGLEVGYRLISLVDKNQGGQLMARIKGVRRKLSQDLGFLIQTVHIRDNLDLLPNQYRISILGIPEGEAEIFPDKELAINAGNIIDSIDGIPTNDPSFGMPAVWIDPSQKDHAQSLGYTVVDSNTVLVTHLSKILYEHAHELFGHEELQHLLDDLSKSASKLVEELVPKTLPMATVVKIVQNLLKEKIPVTNIRTIAETLAEQAPTSQDADTLTASVRVALRRLITKQVSNGMIADEIPVVTLDLELERILLNSFMNGSQAGIGLEPGFAEGLQKSLMDIAQKQESIGQQTILLVNPQLRPWLAKLFIQTVSGLHVLAYNEVVETKKIRVIANIGNDVANSLSGPVAA